MNTEEIQGRIRQRQSCDSRFAYRTPSRRLTLPDRRAEDFSYYESHPSPFAPLQFAAQDLVVGLLRWNHESQFFGRLSNNNAVPWQQFDSDLSVQGKKYGVITGLKIDFDCYRVGNNKRSIGQGVRTNWSQDERLDRWIDDGTSRREGVGGR